LEPVIIIHGPPNSGKSTQAERLAQVRGYTHLSSGQELRNTQDPVIMERMQRGLLALSEDILRLMRAAISSCPADTTIVLDGFPRKLNELHELEAWLKETGRPIKAVLEIAISDEESYRRSYLRKRHEDMNTAVRLKLYEQETRKVLDYSKSKGLLTVIDGSGSVDEVAQRVEAAL